MSGGVVFVVTFLASVVFLSYVFISRHEVLALRDMLFENPEEIALKEKARQMAAEKLAQQKAAAQAAKEAAKQRKKQTPEEEVAAQIAAAAEAAAEEAPPEEEQTEEEAEGEDETPVDENAEGFRQAKVNIMKFLESSLAGMMKEGFKLDGISKFGCHLFLAGASETLGRSSKLGEKEFVKILETCVGVLGSGPEIAKKFGEKYEEYLLEPNYAKMFRSGGAAMENFLAGKGGDLGKALNAAVEEFRNPTEKKGGGPVAVMFTDIVGSTKLTQTLGDAGAQKLVHLHNTVVRNALREFRGTEVKHTGDGIMASFTSCPEAVGAGVAIQRVLNQHRAKDPSILLHLRVGINAGEPIAENGDLFGTTVQLAARICDKASTDGVYVSQVVKDLSQGSGAFENKGTFEMKGVQEAQVLYNVVIPG